MAVSKTPHSSRYMVSYSTLNELGKKQNIYSEEEELSDRDNIEENENSSSEIPDYSDHSAADKNSSVQQGGIWDIPHGAAIGNAWHKVLEETDFTQGIDVDYLKNIMASYGFAKDEYVKSSLAMFNNLLDYQLPCGMKLKELTCETDFFLRSDIDLTPTYFNLRHLMTPLCLNLKNIYFLLS